MNNDKIDYLFNPALPDIELTQASVKEFSFEHHVHLDYHVGAVSKGCMKYSHHGNSYFMSDGLLATINPDEMHNGNSEGEEGYTGHFMALTPELISEISHNFQLQETFFSQPLIDDPKLYSAFLYLHRIASNPNSTEDLQLETVMMAFATELLQRYGKVSNHTCDRVSHLSPTQLSLIRDLFHAEPGQSFNLQALAEPLGLSKFQFLRQFKMSMGMTPHAYLKRIRLEYAKKALLKGHNISDVAYKVGFFDQSHLTKAFKHAFLVTPNHFQQNSSL